MNGLTKKSKHVNWNPDKEGFQSNWIWRYGEGPFRVEQEFDVPTEPVRLRGTALKMKYEPGKWYIISVPDSALNREYPNMGYDQTMFHQKWFSEID